MMSSKNEVSRITIDLPKEQHKKLKSRAAMLGKSMREMVVEAIEAMDACASSNHRPNKKTIKAIKDTEKSIGLIKGKEAEKFAKKLGL